jgi:outer membrane lipoprotein-sorting protein
MRAWSASVLGALIASLELSACAVQPVVDVPDVQANSLAFALADRDQRLDSLQTPAVMEYSGANGHFKAREQVVVRRPASLRVEAMSPLGVALVVAADGGQVAVFDPSKNTLARGAATAATLDRFAQIPMAPQQAVRLLLGLSPDSAMLAFPPSGWNDQGDMKVLRYARPDGTSNELGFSGQHLVLVRSNLPGGKTGYEVRYSEYRDIGGIEFPYQVEASFPATGTTVKLRYERPIIDGNIDDSLFVLSPGPKTKQLNLSKHSAAAAARG